ncbi:hypothetical protein ABFS82_06G182100 [Erythranthe guttata]|uniref:VWFA domain-containing protein n=1 Tax=Erythranthe guttata TaxID=4155 RepID=A0A022RI66_ERYGU|nr:hypothetical protein MIMGU_mgv1a020051mg [Erythranthe guttata]
MTSSGTKICGICRDTLLTKQATFTPDACSHSFHFTCISNPFSFYNIINNNNNNNNINNNNNNNNNKNPSPVCPLCQPISKTLNAIQNTTYKFTSNLPSPPLPRNSPPFVAPPLAPQVVLPKLEPESVHFSDDYPLLEPSSSSSSTVGLQKVTIKAVPEREPVAASESVPQFTVLIGLKAPPLSEDFRAPIDLVTVLDISGSMTGAKLSLVKQAMHFVIDQLGSRDRLSVVSFSDHAKRIFRLRGMTESGKRDAKFAVDTLWAIGGTNIVEGLKKGVRVLGERRYKNPVSSIVFLSDGCDSHNRSYFSQLPPSIYPVGNNGGWPREKAETVIPVHSFGFGTDHDAVTMHAVSDASGGTFSFIESYEMVQGAFASCIGGLLSVVTLGLRLTLRSASDGVVMKSIPSGRYKSEIAEQGSKATINVGDLYADEEKEFLINLSVPREETGGTTSLLDIACSYKDVMSNEAVEIESAELRRSKTVSPSDSKVKLEVDRQRNRLRAAESIAEAQIKAETGDLMGARDLLAKGRTDIVASSSAQAGDDMCVWLEEDIKETERRMGSVQQYQQEGRAYALSGISSHGAQRATTRGKKVAGAALVERSSGGGGYGGRYNPYSTRSMALMVVKSEQLEIDVPIIKKEEN